MSNIVRAVFGGSKTTRTRRLWKIDRGMLLQFVDLNLPTAYQVHFANTPASGQAKVVTATSDTVEIPYEYLQTGADVYAWIYLTPENGVGYTEYMVTIPVYARPDVTDEEPTPTQQSALDTAISALNSGVESVQAAVAGVQDSIDTALQEAKDSGEFDGADGYTPVKGVDYFDGADGYSPAATVTQTETGATVTVTDKTGTTTAEISNGQDGATFTPAVSAEGVISWTNDGGKTNPQPMNIKGPQGDDYILTATDKEEIAQQAAVSLAPALDEKAPIIYCETSGAIASFTDGADDLPVQDLVVQIEPVQAGSGDPSPDNVRTISGWTGVNLTVSPTTDAEDGQTYSISFGSAGTVYGGSLDVTTGVLTVTWGIHDLGARNWSYLAPTASIPYGTFYNTFLEKANGQFNLLCEAYPVKAGFGNDGAIQGNSMANTVYITDSRFNGDVSALKQSLSGVMLAYALNTPITYTITPQEIRTLLGQNNIWADTGDTAVTYPADTKMFVEQNAPESAVQDVQVDGVSVLQDGVANVPVASNSSFGVTKGNINQGIGVDSVSKNLYISQASDSQVKAGISVYKPITPANQHASTFYGLAKAAGSDEKNSTLPVGQYTESAKSAISEMLNGSVSVSGTTPTINALPGIRYICGEVTTIDIVTPTSGIIDVVFTSGSTPAVLTVTPPSGMTMKWANGFDPTALEADTTYEINIADGCLGVAGTWS